MRVLSIFFMMAVLFFGLHGVQSSSGSLVEALLNRHDSTLGNSESDELENGEFSFCTILKCIFCCGGCECCEDEESDD